MSDSSTDVRPEVRTVLGASGYRVESTAGSFPVPSDMPEDEGGEGSAPRPYELLLSAFGACTAMTMRMYAERKGWPLEGVEIALRHDRRKVEPGTPGATPAGWAYVIHREVELRGDGLTAEQRERILEVADKCPVHQSLVHGTVIEDAPLDTR